MLLVALAGQVSGAVQTLHIPLLWAIPAVGALELGGVVVLANADVRRRLGERAIASTDPVRRDRRRSRSPSTGSPTPTSLLAGFFAGMSALGYLVWLMHTENSPPRPAPRARRPATRPPPPTRSSATGCATPGSPSAPRSLAKADPRLGLYDSIAAARAQLRTERRRTAIATVLHRKIRAAVDPTTADIAVHVYDLDEIADRLADSADYDGLTALIASDLHPQRLAAAPPATPRHRKPRWRRCPPTPKARHRCPCRPHPLPQSAARRRR